MLEGDPSGSGHPELGQHPGATDHAESGQTRQDLGVRVDLKGLGQLPLQGADLLVELGQDGHGGGHDLAVGGRDRGRGGQLWAGQGLVELGGAAVQVAPPASSPSNLASWAWVSWRPWAGVGAAASNASA